MSWFPCLQVGSRPTLDQTFLCLQRLGENQNRLLQRLVLFARPETSPCTVNPRLSATIGPAQIMADK